MASNLVGQILLDQFRIESFIAAGGMGAVYRVWDLQRSAWLAIKMLHADLADDPVVFRRFEREANALKKLAHPHIVPFYGLYQDEDFAFLVERYIDGPSLQEILRRRQGQPLPVEETMVYLKCVSSALGYAHTFGVVHCDVKPGNAMVDSGGNVYLTDFGIARHADSTTTTAAGFGTPAYMAPEQIQGAAVSAATDIYALGVLAYEMFTGRRPFTGEENLAGLSEQMTTNERLRVLHLKADPPDPRAVRPTLPATLSPVLLRALEKNPQRRPESTAAFWQEICGALTTASEQVGERVAAPAPYRPNSPQVPTPEYAARPSVGQPEAAQSPGSKPPAALPLSSRQYGRRTNAAAVIVGLVGLVLAGFLLLSGLNQGQPALPSGISTGATVEGGQNVASSSGAAVETPEVTVLPTLTSPPQPSANQPPTSVPTPPSEPPTRAPTQPLIPPAIAGDQRTNAQDGADLVYIPEGQFWQGLDDELINMLLAQCSNCEERNFSDARPLHPVTLSAYWIYRYEVTNVQYQDCVDQGACNPPRSAISRTRDSYYGNALYANYPVVYVSWQQAQAFCRWAGGRLPSEAEWEKAARGSGDTRLYPWGSSPSGGRLANNDAIQPDLTEVGAYPGDVSPYGLMDMAGNVYEWTNDWYAADYYNHGEEINPTGPPSGDGRVIRGSSQDYRAAFGAVSFRGFKDPGDASDQNGFRCVVDGDQ